jgi:hypothetical protein
MFLKAACHFEGSWVRATLTPDARAHSPLSTEAIALPAATTPRQRGLNDQALRTSMRNFYMSNESIRADVEQAESQSAGHAQKRYPSTGHSVARAQQ